MNAGLLHCTIATFGPEYSLQLLSFPHTVSFSFVVIKKRSQWQGLQQTNPSRNSCSVLLLRSCCTLILRSTKSPKSILALWFHLTYCCTSFKENSCPLTVDMKLLISAIFYRMQVSNKMLLVCLNQATRGELHGWLTLLAERHQGNISVSSPLILCWQIKNWREALLHWAIWRQPAGAMCISWPVNSWAQLAEVAESLAAIVLLDQTQPATMKHTGVNVSKKIKEELCYFLILNHLCHEFESSNCGNELLGSSNTPKRKTVSDSNQPAEGSQSH